MIIHIQTALTMIALGHLACGTVMGLIWLRNRDIRGLSDWTIARLFIVISYALYASRDALAWPLLPSVLLSNGLLFISLYLMWLGNAKFMQAVPRNSSQLFFVIFTATLGALAYYSQIDNSYPTRVIISSTWVTLWAMLCIRTLRSSTPQANYLSVKALIIPYGLLVVCHLFRVSCHVQGSFENSFLNGGIVTGLTIVSDIVIVMFTAIATMALIVEELHINLQHEANHDALTNAFNRRAFYAKADELVSEARKDNASISLLTIDLDYFKKVNDEFGHTVGDKVLANFVQTIKLTLRDNDLFARFGGEEFVVLLSHTDQKTACRIAEKIRTKIEASRLSEELDIGHVTCSIGVASVDQVEHEFLVSNLVDKSDKLLYRAKISGRNQVSCC